MIFPQIFMKWRSFSQSSMSGALTLIVRNAIYKHVSGLALLVTYSVFATIVWKSAAIYSGNFSLSSFTMNRLSGAGVS
jgi:hypothetical protein